MPWIPLHLADLSQKNYTFEWPLTHEGNCLVGLMQSEKTSLMTTPKHLGVQIWQMNLCLLMDPPVPEQKYLENQYTKLQMNLFWLMDPPSTRAEMSCIPAHTTWQMTPLWLMPPQYQSRDALHTSTHNLADDPNLAGCSNLADEPLSADGTPRYQSRNALNTSTHNLADEPTLADGPPSTRAKMPCIPLHTNLADDPALANGPHLVPKQRCLAYQYIPVHKTRQMNLLSQWTSKVTDRDSFTLLLTSSGQQWHFTLLLTSSGQKCLSSHCYWHLVVKNGNFTLLLTSSGQKWQVHIGTDI